MAKRKAEAGMDLFEATIGEKARIEPTKKVYCNCGAVHAVAKSMVGTCDWWLCEACLDRKSAEFDRDMARLIPGYKSPMPIVKECLEGYSRAIEAADAEK